METLRNTRLDQSAGHQRRAEIRRLVRSPRPRDGHLAGLDAITLKILERPIPGHGEFVCEGSESPALAAGVPAAHQRITPIEVAAPDDVDVDALIDARVGKRDQRVPMAV